ncbi:rab11 family-interacting protein 5 isoform 2-T2 [Discoglossus pictus]
MLGRWYKLHSKSGKKEKERGEIQVSIQFTRNNLTASMFDLSIKDKPKTPFGKLKDKMKVKKRFDMESSSAIVPSNVGRLDDDDDEKKPKSKAAFFLKGRLRKNSLTKSNTSLGSDSTISSTSGTVPSNSGISIVLPDVGKKPASRNSSLSTEPSVKDQEASPRLTHKRAFSDEVNQLKLFPEPKSVQNLKPKSSPISKSSVCINGSHVYTEVTQPKPTASPLEKSSPASWSFQNIAKKNEEASVPEEAGEHMTDKKQEWKPSGPTMSSSEEPKLSARITVQKSKNEDVRQDSKPVQVTTPMVFIDDMSKTKHQEGIGKDEKKPKVSQVDYGPGKNELGGKSLVEQSARTSHVPASTDEKGKADSWFSPKHTKDTHHKPSFPSGSIATSEAAEWGSFLVEEHSPLAISPPTEDKKESLSKEGFQDKFEDFPFASNSFSKVARFPSEWEVQFDEFASSRLQSPSDAQRTVDTTDDIQDNGLETVRSYPYASIQVLESGSTAVSVPTLDSPHDLHVQVLDTPSLDNTSNTETASRSDSPLPIDYLSNNNTSYIPPVLSARIRTSSKDLLHDQNSAGPHAKEQNTECKSQERSVLWNADQQFSANSVPTVVSKSSYPDKNECDHMTPKIYSSDYIPAVDVQLNEDALTHIPGEPITSENRVATISPLILKDNFPSGPLLNPNEPCENRDFVNMVQTANTAVEQVIESSIVTFAKELQSSVNPEGGASMEHSSNRLFGAPDEDAIPYLKLLEADRVNQAEGSLYTTSGNVASMGPPKPPRLMLSSTFEEEEDDGDNYKQTSNQDNRLNNTTEKHLENPKEKVPKQNIEVGKQILSPVTCSPIIEVGSITQSTTEDILTNLSVENNDLTKPGVSNKEHLLDVNETTMTEQFRTCPSKVSLDGLDLSSAEESTNKLDVLKLRLRSELINDDQSLNLESIKQEFVVRNVVEHVPMTKEKEIGRETQSANSSVRIDHSSLPFLTALEEHQPKLEKSLDMKEKAIEYPDQLQGEWLDNKPALTVNAVKGKEGKSGLSMSQQSSWSADILVDFKNEDFWKSESNILESSATKSLPSPSNPFTPTDKNPPQLSHKNPFAKDSLSSLETEKDLPTEDSYKDPPPFPPLETVKSPVLHDKQPLAFSTPFLATTSNPKISKFPFPVMASTTSEVTNTANVHAAALSRYHSSTTSGMKDSAPPVLPKETQPDEKPFLPLKHSPHPVKPISTSQSDSISEKKSHKPALTTAINSGLEKLKSVTSGQHSAPKKPELDHIKDVCAPDMAAKYYHLTHDELINLLLQRETELGKKAEHVRELEDYIDQLLVRIMDQAPTLLQVPLESKKK